MLDQLFYQLDRSVVVAGPDWAIIGVFLLMFLVFLYSLAARKIERLLQAGSAIVVLLIVTYIPFVCFPQILEFIYLHLGLITSWYLEVPFVIRFPTLWLFAILAPVFLWTVTMILSDLLRGKPILSSQIAKRDYEEALEVSRRYLLGEQANRD